LAKRICRDPDDDAVLALGLAGHVELIISGDKDLLSVAWIEGIEIVDPNTALGLIR